MSAEKISVSLVIVSDRAHTGQRKDETAPVLLPLFSENLYRLVTVSVIPDDYEAIRKTLSVLSSHSDLILTSGGTGLSPRDVTPEATESLGGKPVPGIAGFLRRKSQDATPFAVLSRGTAVVYNQTLIVNLPGSPKGSRECTEWLLPLIPHAIGQITGRETGRHGH